MRNNKGFTLIELLVVVAIIGILAAVGVVAYNGYTNSAKINASKSNHNAAVKYMAAEVQKCNVGEETAFGGAITCESFLALDAESKATAVADATVTELNKSFKNPHSTSKKALAKTPTSSASLPNINILNELFGVTTALATSHDNSSDDTVAGSETDSGATAATSLYKGETLVEANQPSDGEITVQTKFDDCDDEYLNSVVGTS